MTPTPTTTGVASGVPVVGSIARMQWPLHGGPLLATTLILPGETDPLNDPEEIRDRLEKQVAGVIEAGACPLDPTTVIDLTTSPPEVLRRGRGDPATLGL